MTENISPDDLLKNFSESVFLEAKQNPGLRQSYLDNRNWKNVLPFVEKISYVPRTSGNYSTSKPIFFNIRKKFNNDLGIRIELHDTAFDNVFIDSEKDFLHSLYNRAGYEAYEKYVSHPMRTKHINIMCPDWGKPIQELLNKIRVDTYCLNTANGNVGYNYKLFLENIIDSCEKQVYRYFSNSSRYSPFLIENKHIKKLLDENKPIIETPIFEF